MHNVEGCAGIAGTEPQAWRAGLMNDITYVGLDVHKATVCVAIAESGRGGEVREVGVFEDRPDVLRKMVARLGKHRRRLNFCYEAAPSPSRCSSISAFRIRSDSAFFSSSTSPSLLNTSRSFSIAI